MPPQRPIPPHAPRPGSRGASDPPARRAAARRRGRRRLAALGATVLVAAALAVLGVRALGGRGDPARHDDPPARAPRSRAAAVAYNVGEASCTFVDTSRGVHDYATGQWVPERRLPTEVLYPTTNGASGAETRGAHPAYRHGPFPLVVFASGFAIPPADYAPLLEAWVRAGFVVAAPTFPDTNPAAVQAAGGAGEEDEANQPGDVAFVAKQLEATARGQSADCAVVRHLVAVGPVAVAGQSDGANTVAALGYEVSQAPFRAGLDIRADLVLSGSELDDAPGAYASSASSPPLLFVQSRNDTCNTPQEATELYDALRAGDKWFLETGAATHLGPYTGKEPEVFAVVSRVSIAFLKAELGGGPAVGTELREAAAGAGTVATLSGGVDAPAMAGTNFVKASCFVDA